ncbi:MAG: thymidylate synthase [Terriglobia bacterium]
MAAENRSRVTGLTVVIDGIVNGQPDEDTQFRDRLNQVLNQHEKTSVETVSRTIFPAGLWNPEAPRKQLYDRYLKILPKLRGCRKNKKGHYFERLINFPAAKGSPGFNQLEQVITAYRAGTHRVTALQACLMNPLTDLNNSPYLGFPCLQQVAFMPKATDGSLTVLGFYPMHYLFERAYGNYLGLIALGHFMATEMGLALSRMICVAGVARLEVARAHVESLLL